MPHRFDVLDPAHMEGYISIQVLDPDLDPQQVLQDNLDFHIKVDWSVEGKDQNGVQDVSALGGEWTVRAFADGIGNVFEGQIGATQVVPLSSQPATSPRSYTTTINITAGTLEPGAYELVVLVNYTNLSKPLRMAAFAEAPVIQIYHFE